MDRNVDKAFGLSLSVIAYSLFAALIAVLFVTAYRYFDLKVSGEGMNQSLVKTGSYSQEEEDILLYTGKSVYSTAKGDAVNTTLHGSTVVSIPKLSDADFRSMGITDTTKAHSAGEPVTGASVFAELLSLPSSVTRVTINGHSLDNDPLHADQATITYPNVAYYVALGDTRQLYHDAAIQYTDNYAKYYIYDGNGYITQIAYIKL